MQIRWQAHRYMIGQSLGFFQNEFAGRIATKVMQTALSVREVVMKTLDILVYVSVYFFSILFLVISADWAFKCTSYRLVFDIFSYFTYPYPKIKASVAMSSRCTFDDDRGVLSIVTPISPR